MPEQDDLDLILDSALHAYANPEPLEGLSHRILARMEAASAKRRLFWWFAPATVLAALLLLLVMRTSRPPAELVLSVPAPPAVVHVPYAAAYRPPVPVRNHTVLTSTERALLALTTQYPEQARQAFEDWRIQSSQPIEIKPIQITPLDISQ